MAIFTNYEDFKYFCCHRNKLNILLLLFEKSCFATIGIRWITWISLLFSSLNIINWQTFKKFRPVWPRLDPEKNDLTQKKGFIWSWFCLIFFVLQLLYKCNFRITNKQVKTFRNNCKDLILNISLETAFQRGYLHLNIDCLFAKLVKSVNKWISLCFTYFWTIWPKLV